jgi:DNA invertase Pin-like site-specific DNA recombinase
LEGQTMSKIVVYYRVSTEKQQLSGLGIDAQKAAVRSYTARTGDVVLARYTETESGRNADRPQLARALAHARRSRAKLIVAKLDRLSRNLAFLDALQRSKVAFVALDAEFANKMTLQILMVMAEHECEQVSARTKAALAASHKSLGAANPACRNLTKAAARKGRHLGNEANARLADEAYTDILPDMTEWRAAGMTLAQIADNLNAEGHTTRQGCAWTTGTVANVLRRAVVACA